MISGSPLSRWTIKVSSFDSFSNANLHFTTFKGHGIDSKSNIFETFFKFEMTEQIESLQCSLRASEEENGRIIDMHEKLQKQLETQNKEAEETFERLHRDKANEFEHFCEERKKFEDVNVITCAF